WGSHIAEKLHGPNAHVLVRITEQLKELRLGDGLDRPERPKRAQAMRDALARAKNAFELRVRLGGDLSFERALPKEPPRLTHEPLVRMKREPRELEVGRSREVFDSVSWRLLVGDLEDPSRGPQHA